MKFLCILASRSWGCFSNKNCMTSRPSVWRMFVYKLSESKYTNISLGSVDCGSLLTKSVVSLI